MDKQALHHYATAGVNDVHGMLQSGSLAVIWSLIELQDHWDVRGQAAEIGVFRGKTFLLLCHGLRDGEIGIGVDVFGDPIGSNSEDLDIFHANMAKYGFAPDRYKLELGNSLRMSTADMAGLCGGENVRLFSVDGDHSKEAVLSDLALAAGVLAPDGVIIADDLFNPWYPTVTEAVYEFFLNDAYAAQRGDLVPIAFSTANGPVETGAGKLMIARAPAAAAYKAGVRLLHQDDLKHNDPFAGHENVPTFCFGYQPSKRPLDEFMAAILDDIFPNGPGGVAG